MTAPSALTQPNAKDPSTWGVPEWTTVLHNAVQVRPDNPRYQEAQQYVQDAIQNIGALNQQASAADIKAAGQLAPGALGSALAGVVGFGRGASLGAIKPPTVDVGGVPTDVIGKAHPTATTVGDVAGGATLMAAATPLVASLSPAAGGAFLGGTMGAARGAIDPMLGDDRIVNSILGGTIGAALGGIGGRILGGKAPPGAPSGLIPKATIILRNTKAAGLKIAGYFTRQGAAPDEALQATESVVRNYFANLPDNIRPSPERIEAVIADSKPLWTRGAPQPALAAQARPVVPPEPRIAPTPAPAPATPTPVTPISSAPRAATEVPAPSATGAVTKSGRNVADILREGERVMGRPLSAAEKDAVLQRLFGARSAHPGHPLWFGPGAPTE